jgi:uncharacterized glyoxalase superfamily protein PhnB
MLQQAIPILRIFDEDKARAFYIDWLGFTIDFEHRFEPETPLYMGIHKDFIQLHLSEHHGDSTPGSKVYIVCQDIEKYNAKLVAKNYKYYRPSVEQSFYNTLCMVVQDPFGNKLSFNQELE